MLKENLEAVEARVAAACERAGRKREDVTLIAVSKTKPVSDIREIMACGMVDFGENKVQELCGKLEEIKEPLRWHLIGHLQRNKVKYIVDKVYMIHSVDSVRLAQEIQKEAEKHQVDCQVLVEINIGGEESKSGVAPEEAVPLIREIAALSRVHVKGLMTVAPPVEKSEDARGYFKRMRKLFEAVKAEQIPGVEMMELSMGMTGDFETAIEEGATMVRVGTAIFGARQYAV
ncbi:YggS family pyridoxal phosphate-dependent enzyme [Fusibacillus kribbianus]|uniref:Pyridoxal phosphate homeostasis protein n=1 Tax=Fusibacillus kribbianus TaxID=3044208 RepID=A0AAP4B7Y5_9FIRM|nr:YggS family pyridoxal phosphate-dependent enzyme [Ruminococcus sp. YH-rum2234]MDI9241409.1 YggS family pyridoxal phosphate-dependent enzyme [Ruminococcus sp. YH-rum2234]